MASIRRFAADRRGMAAIEFAIIAPVYFLITLVLIEVALVFTASMTLEAGARAASRYGLTGAMVDGRTRAEIIREIVTAHVCPEALDADGSTRCYWSADGPLSVDENGGLTPLFLATRAYTDPRNIGIGEPFADSAPFNGRFDVGESFEDLNGNGVFDADAGRANAGGPNDFVVYRVGMWQRVVNPLVRAALGGEHIYHEARLVIRNEPY